MHATSQTLAPGRSGVASQTPHVFCIEWNAENQLTRVTKNSVEQARFKYDPYGRRVEKVAGAVTTSFTYAIEDILRQIAGSSTLKYIQGPGVDEPLATDDGSTLSYLHQDGLGSVVKATSPSGVVTLIRQYDAWGGLQSGSGAGYAFTSREWDPEARLNYYRARYYDSSVGRFISEDPKGFYAGDNFFRYVQDRPTVLMDPSGLTDSNSGAMGGPSACMANWMAAGTIIGGTFGASGGTVVAVGSGGIAVPAIPGGWAGGAAAGAAAGGLIGAMVCAPPPPLCMPKVKEDCFRRWKGCVSRCDADYNPFRDPENNRLCRDHCKIELLLCQEFL